MAKKLCEASKEKHALRVRITSIKQKSEENLMSIEPKDFYSINEKTESAGNSSKRTTYGARF